MDGNLSLWIPDSWVKDTAASSNVPNLVVYKSPDGKGRLSVSTMMSGYAQASVPAALSTGRKTIAVPGVPGTQALLGYFPGQAVGGQSILGYVTEVGNAWDRGFDLGGQHGVASVSYTRPAANAGQPSESNPKVAAVVQTFVDTQEGIDVRKILSSVTFNPSGNQSASVGCRGAKYEYGDLENISCDTAKKTMSLLDAHEYTQAGAHSVNVKNGFLCISASAAEMADDPAHWIYACHGMPGTKIASAGFHVWDKGKKPVR